MAGTNIVIGGGSGSSSGGSPTEGSVLSNSSRMIFNEFTSNNSAHNPLLPHTLISGGILVQNQGYVYATTKAKSIITFRPSASNANSGVRVAGPWSFGHALGKGSYAKCIIRFVGQTTPADNDLTKFRFGFNSSNTSDTLGNAGIWFKIDSGVLAVETRAAGVAVEKTTEAFTNFDEYLIFEITYLTDSQVKFTITSLDTGSVLFEYTVDDATNVPSAITQGSGEHVNCYSSCTRTTAGSEDICVYDYLGFGELEL